MAFTGKRPYSGEPSIFLALVGQLNDQLCDRRILDLPPPSALPFFLQPKAGVHEAVPHCGEALSGHEMDPMP